MKNQDVNNSLESHPFSYRQYKNGKISILWNAREVLILNGEKAARFSTQVENATESESQMIMAKLTGNFKRGNEREGKLKGR